MRRAEFYRWRPQGAPPAAVPWYVLVLSDDGYNATGAWPICAHVVRPGEGSLYLVPLADADPIGGRLALNSVGALDPATLDGPTGMVTGATYERITIGMRALFGI